MNIIEDMMKMVETRQDTWFYEHVTGFEIKHQNESWHLRKIPESGRYGGVWVQFDASSYNKWFNTFNIDMLEFQEELYRSCLMEAVYHKHMYDDLRESLGGDAVDSAELDFKAFGENLKSTIEGVTRRQDIKLV